MNLLKKITFNHMQCFKWIFLVFIIIILMGLPLQIKGSPVAYHGMKLLRVEPKSTRVNFSKPKMIKGVFDRAEGNRAVILLEEIDEELVILREHLPKDSREGTWLFILVSPTGYRVLELDQKMTKEKQEESYNLYQQLQGHSSSIDF